MSENGEGEAKYQLITDEGVKQKSSRGFTGGATATYENGDIYQG